MPHDPPLIHSHPLPCPRTHSRTHAPLTHSQRPPPTRTHHFTHPHTHTLTLTHSHTHSHPFRLLNHSLPHFTHAPTWQIESLVRLAEARARLELREEVTQQDAEDVVEMMKCAVSCSCPWPGRGRSRSFLAGEGGIARLPWPRAPHPPL